MYKKMKKYAKKVIKKLSGNNISDKDMKYVVMVAERTGENQKKAVTMMRDAKKRIGISFKDYCENEFYIIPVEMQEEKYKMLLQVKEAQKKLKEQKEERKKINRERKETCINKTMEATGWTREYAVSKIEDARKRTGCQYKEYYIYKFYQLTDEEQEQMCLINFTSRLSDYYNVNMKFADTLDNKAKANEFFANYMKRPWCVNTQVSFDEFVKVFEKCNKIIYKPILGIGGHGIQTFEISEDNIQDVYNEVSKLPEGVVEDYVVQHPVMSQLSPGAVNTIRVVTIVSNTKEVTADGRHMDFAYAALRIGEGKAEVDNFHSGGMTAAVDLETGTVMTAATDMEGNVYQTHPLTGVQIKGFEIPFFKDVLKMLEEICEHEMVEGNLGWDIAITENGPVIIEANIGPGIVLLQAPYAVEKKGVKHIMEKYLPQDEDENARKKRERKEACINATVEATGWSREYAVKQIADARKRLGIKYLEYYKNDFYFIPVEEQEERYAQLKKQKAELEKSREEAIEKIMAKTGWTQSETKERVAQARKRTGCDAKEFFIYRFYELTEEEQAKVFLIKESKQIAEKFDTNARFRGMLTDKEATNRCFSEYLKRPWCVNTKVSEKEFVKMFKKSKRIIYKPLNGNRGFGVEAFDIDKNNAKEVYKKLQLLPAGVVEQYVVQHPAMSSLTPESVNTLRIVMIASNTKPVTPDGKYMDIAYSALRIGGGSSVVDNFHSGGMVAAVDLETGILVTDAADMEGNVFEKHPVTGTTIKGFEIPYFKEAVQMAVEACKKSKIEGYIGWDIAITENGPVLIEINLRPGVVLLSMPYAAAHKGMRDVMKKYLES